MLNRPKIHNYYSQATQEGLGITNEYQLLNVWMSADKIAVRSLQKLEFMEVENEVPETGEKVVELVCEDEFFNENKVEDIELLQSADRIDALTYQEVREDFREVHYFQINNVFYRMIDEVVFDKAIPHCDIKAGTVIGFFMTREGTMLPPTDMSENQVSRNAMVNEMEYSKKLVCRVYVDDPSEPFNSCSVKVTSVAIDDLITNIDFTHSVTVNAATSKTVFPINVCRRQFKIESDFDTVKKGGTLEIIGSAWVADGDSIVADPSGMDSYVIDTSFNGKLPISCDGGRLQKSYIVFQNGIGSVKFYAADLESGDEAVISADPRTYRVSPNHVVTVTVQ